MFVVRTRRQRGMMFQLYHCNGRRDTNEKLLFPLKYLWVLSMELASCHHSVNYNLVVATTFLESFCISSCLDVIFLPLNCRQQNFSDRLQVKHITNFMLCDCMPLDLTNVANSTSILREVLHTIISPHFNFNQSVHRDLL